MANYIIPPIGTKGKFEFKEPFNTGIKANQELMVYAIRTIQELVDSGENPYEFIYKNVGLSEDDMNKDLDDSIPIIVLASGSNEYYYVPANRLSSLPNISGVKYQQKMLAINVGPLPIDYNLDLAKDTIRDAVLESMGINSTVEVIAASAISYKTDNEHIKYMKLINGKKTINTSYKTRYKQLLETYNKLLVKVEYLEKCALEHHIPQQEDD